MPLGVGVVVLSIAIAVFAAVGPSNDESLQMTVVAPGQPGRGDAYEANRREGLSAPAVPAEAATLLAAGDIGLCGGAAPETGALVDARPDATFAPLGDLAYPAGTATDFGECYDPFFGAAWNRTRPALGNHEYDTPDAAGYFGYFGDRGGAADEGYYSYDLGAWHVVVLNSECWKVGGCGVGEPQHQWLAADLAANGGECVLAYWHRAVFSTEAGYEGADYMAPAYELLLSAGADVLLTGHSHVYERWARLDVDGNPDPAGIRNFTVGTGGTGLRQFGETQVGLEARGRAHGLLELTLRHDGYDWQFLASGATPLNDSGSDRC